MMKGFKYRANTVLTQERNFRDEETLINDEIYASNFESLNDPFESTYIDTLNQLFTLLKTFGIDNKPVLDKWAALKGFKDIGGVFSLSTSSSGLPDNELMWAHYANSHKGFCIEYDIEKLYDSEKLPFNVNKFDSITYSDTPPTVTFEDIKDLNALIEKL